MTRRGGIELTNTDRQAIRLYRLTAKKSRQVVADALGRSKRYIHRIECGGSAILTAADLVRLGTVLGVEPTDLVAAR